MDKHMNEVYCSNVNNDDDHHTQIKAWIWEAAIKLGFQDISQRVQADFNLKDLIETHFEWGRDSVLLRCLYKLQEIITEIEIKNCISTISLSHLQSLSQNLLFNRSFHEEKEFVKKLLAFHYSASLLIFDKTGQLQIEGSSCLPVEVSEWTKIKEILGFKDDKHKHVCIGTLEVVQTCIQAILKKKLSEKDHARGLETLLSRLKSIYSDIIKLLRPPILIHFCNPETRKELLLLNSPVHALLLKHIRGKTITRDCLHSLLDELGQASPKHSLLPCIFTPDGEAGMKTKISKLPSRLGFQKRIKIPEKDALKPTHCQNREWQKDYDIVILKGVAWELRNIDTTDVCQRIPSVQSRGVVDITRNGDSGPRSSTPNSTKGSQNENVYKIHLEHSAETFSVSVDSVEKLSRELDSMAELIENAKTLVTELEARYESLKAQKDELVVKSNGNQDNNNVLRNGKEGSMSRSASVCCLDELESGKSRNSSRPSSSFNLIVDCNDGMHNGDSRHSESEGASVTEAATLPCNNNNNNNSSSSQCTSIPELVPHFPNVDMSIRFNASTFNMPSLTPNWQPTMTKPFVRLSPLSQSIIDKYAGGGAVVTSLLSSDEESRRGKRKGDKAERKRRWNELSSDIDDSSGRGPSPPSCERKSSSLSKIDLRVTELHSSTGNDVVVLESDKQTFSQYRERTSSEKRGTVSSSSSSSSSAVPSRGNKTSYKLKRCVRKASCNTPKEKKRSSSKEKSSKVLQQKKKNSPKKVKSSKHPFIVTSTLWNRKIYSSGSSSCSSGLSDGFSSGAESSPLIKVSAFVQSRKSTTGKTDSAKETPKSASSEVSNSYFFTPAQSPEGMARSKLGASPILRTSSVEVTAGIRSSSQCSSIPESEPTQESGNSEIRNCEVTLTLKKIHLDAGVIDVYS